MTGFSTGPGATRKRKVTGGSPVRVSVISTARGQALADEFGIPFAETSAKSGVNVTEAFMKIAGDIRSRMVRSKSTPQAGGIAPNSSGSTAKSKCC